MPAWWILALAPAAAASDYVDPAACAPCHAGIADTYRRTGMGRSFSRPRFDAGASYHHAASERSYTLDQRDGRWFLRRSPDAMEKEVHYVLGSGNHSRALLHRALDGSLRQLPIAWYAERGGFWAMAPGYDRPDHLDFRRRVNPDCLFCHNGYARGPEPAEGIDCQRCHGPGRAHVETAGRGPIVNPARLSRDRQLEVCFQCHLETTSFRLPYAVRRYGRDVSSYRPGEPLSDYMLHFDHAPGSGHEDKFEVAGAPYRLMQSACFERSGRLTCTTCHNPHDIPRGDDAARHYAAACRTCHTLKAAPPHTASADCRPCHMPRRRTGDAIHVAMTDHRIVRRPPAGDPLALRSEFHDDRAGAYTGEVVLYWPKTLPPDPETDLYLALAQVIDNANLRTGIERLRAAVRRHRPTRGEFYFELAEAYRKLGRHADAAPYYEEARKRRAPGLDTARFQNDLGESYLQQNRAGDAVVPLRRAIALDPDLPEAHTNLGVALARTGDLAGAEQSLREALRIEPNLAEAHLNLGIVLMGRDRGAARYHLERAAARGNADVRRKARELLQ